MGEADAAGWASVTLEFFSETGTEGGWWACQVDGYAHGADFVCGSTSCPLLFREELDHPGRFSLRGMGRRSSEVHTDYAGLYTLANGDGLQLLTMNAVGVEVVVGESLVLELPLQTDQYARDTYVAGGALVSHQLPAVGVEPAVWEGWFFEGRRARVRSAAGRLPVTVADLTQVFPGGHYVD